MATEVETRPAKPRAPTGHGSGSGRAENGSDQGIEQLSPALKEQIAQAAEPLVGELRKQIADVVKAKSAWAGGVDADKTQKESDRGLQPGRMEVEQDMGQTVQERQPTQQDTEQQTQEPSGQSTQPQGQQQNQPQAQETQDQAKQSDQSDGQNGNRAGDGKNDPLVALLRKQIIDAMDPVLDDLRENVAQAVQDQMPEAIKLSDDDLHRKIDQSLEPIRHEVESEAEQTIQDAKNEREKPPQTKLQEAIQRTVKALKETMQWLARTLRALLKTVVALLKAVLNLVLVILLALFEGLKSLGGSVMHGVKAAGQGIMNGLKNMLIKGGEGIIDKLIPDSKSESSNQQEDGSKGEQDAAQAA